MERSDKGGVGRWRGVIREREEVEISDKGEGGGREE